LVVAHPAARPMAAISKTVVLPEKFLDTGSTSLSLGLILKIDWTV